MPMPSGRGHSTDRTRVPGQNIRISRSDRWIALKSFHEFSKAVVDGVAWNRVRHTNAVRSRLFHLQHQSTGSKGQISRSDRWIALKFFSRVSGGCFRWSRVEMGTTRRCRPVEAIPPTGPEYRVVRSEPFHRQEQITGSKGPYLEIRQLDRAQNFFNSFRRLFSME